MDISLTNAEIIYREFEKKLSIVNRKELNFKLIKNLLLTVFVFFVLAFVLIVSESIFFSGSKVRYIMYWGYILTLAATLSYIISNYFFRITNILHPFNVVNFARYTGNKFHSIKDTLSNSLSLFRFVRENGNQGMYFSSELIAADLESVKLKAGSINFASFIPYKILKKSGLLIAGIILLFAVSFAIFPSALSSSLNRIFNYNYNFINGEYGIIFDIHPGDVESLKGDKVSVTIRVIPNKPGLTIDEIGFFTKNITGDGISVPLSQKSVKADSDGTFKTEIDSINTSLIYYAEFQGIKSGEYKITLAEYPVIRKFKVTIKPPDFTGLPVKVLDENQGDVYCLQNSIVTFELTASSELSRAGIIFNGNSTAFSVDGETAGGSIQAKDDGNYKFKLFDKDGTESKNENTYEIKIIRDKPPEIYIVYPQEQNYTLKGEKEITLRAQITDDFGFSRLLLGFKKISGSSSASPVYNIITIPVKNTDATSLEVPFVWDLSPLNLRSGESVEYYMEVTDNTGNTTRSAVRTLIYQSLAEFLKKSEQFTQDLRRNLKSINDYLDDIRKEMKDAKNDSKNTEDLGLNDPARNKELLNKIESLQNTLDAAQNKIDDSMKELDYRNMLDEKTYEKYMKLQELYNKINNPEFREKLKELQEALKKNNPDQIREAMKNFNFDEEEFKKQMEQLMELLKKIENLQKLAELTQKMDEMKKDQEALKQETLNTDPNYKPKMDELSGKQNSLTDRMNDFKEDLKDLISKIKDTKDEFDANKLEKIKNKIDSKNTKNKMQKSANQLESGNKQESENTQDDILSDLEELNEDMQDAFDSAMSSDLDEKAINKLKEIKESVEQLSKEQQDLKERTEDTKKSDKEEFKEKSREQNKLQNTLTQDINDLMELSREGIPVSPELGKEFGNAYNSMDKAAKDLGTGEKDNATSNQGKAKTALDNASKLLGDLISSLEKQGNKKGKDKGNPGRMGQLMQRLSELIGRQQGANEKMSKLGNNGKRGTDGRGGQEELTLEEKIQLEKLKLEQQDIAKSLEELNAEFEREKENTGEKLLGDLNEVIKEMKEVIKELEENKFDEELLKKQNRILSRMLDAQLSQREKDFEQKRESKPGENIVRVSPPEIVISGPKSFNAFKEDFLRLQKQGYTEDYEALITKYLMNLRNNQ